MPTTSDLRNSRFLTKLDCDPSIQLTISHITREDVSPEGRGDLKYVAHWEEPGAKPWVLNPTNGDRIGDAISDHDMDNWGGVKVELYHDPNIAFAGKVVGGIRVKTAFRPDDFGDDLPFGD